MRPQAESRYWRVPDEMGGWIGEELFHAHPTSGGYLTLRSPEGRKVLLDPKDLTAATRIPPDPQGGDWIDQNNRIWRYSPEQERYVQSGTVMTWGIDWLTLWRDAGPLRRLIPVDDIALPYSPAEPRLSIELIPDRPGYIWVYGLGIHHQTAEEYAFAILAAVAEARRRESAAQVSTPEGTDQS